MGFPAFFSFFYFRPHFLSRTVKDAAHEVSKEGMKMKAAEGANETQALDAGWGQLLENGYGGSYTQ